MAKVLQRLVRMRLLASTQGTRGGYMLGRPAAAISVTEVIEAIDGPFTVTACSTDKHDCEQFNKCSIRDPLWQIRERIAAALGTVAIAEIAADNIASPVAVSRAAGLHNARPENRSGGGGLRGAPDWKMKIPIYMDYHATKPGD